MRGGQLADPRNGAPAGRLPWNEEDGTVSAGWNMSMTHVPFEHEVAALSGSRVSLDTPIERLRGN